MAELSADILMASPAHQRGNSATKLLINTKKLGVELANQGIQYLYSIYLDIYLLFCYSTDQLLFPPPDAVEDVAVWKDPDVEVGGEDVVELPDLLVPEEGVRHPHLARVSQGQVLDPLWRKINVECR